MMDGKKKYINIFVSFTEPFNCSFTAQNYATSGKVLIRAHTSHKNRATLTWFSRDSCFGIEASVVGWQEGHLACKYVVPATSQDFRGTRPNLGWCLEKSTSYSESISSSNNSSSSSRLCSRELPHIITCRPQHVALL